MPGGWHLRFAHGSGPCARASRSAVRGDRALTLKNIARPVEAFVLRLDPAAQEPTTGEAQAVPRPRSPVACSPGSWGCARWGRRHGMVARREGPFAGYRVSPHRRLPRPKPTCRRTVGVSTAPPLSMVVLPFDNLGGDRMEDYLTDGITEDVTTDLSRVPGMFVIARDSALRYKGKAFDVKQVGKELGVRYAVEGSARKVGNIIAHECAARLDGYRTACLG